ncbi:CoA-binding protein, partial [Bacteroidota bacterium]
RYSHKVAKYMADEGYKVYGVNPKLAGKTVNGIKCFSSLDELPDKVDIVDIFRKPDAVLNIVKDVLELEYTPKVIWTQLGIFNENAKELALRNEMEYIENKCLYIEHRKNGLSTKLF